MHIYQYCDAQPSTYKRTLTRSKLWMPTSYLVNVIIFRLLISGPAVIDHRK